MLEGIFTIMITLYLLVFYAIIGFAGFMIIQLISYRVFKFNLYKWLLKKMLRGN